MKKSINLGRRATDIYTSVMLLLFPLFTGFKGYGSITEAKLVFFLVPTVLWALALIAALFTDGKRPELHMTPVMWLLLAFLGLCCVSAALSPYGAADILIGAGRFDGLLHTLLCVVIFFGVSIWGRPRRRYGLLLCISMGLCALVSTLQLFGLNPLGLYPEGLTYYDRGTLYIGEFLGTIGNGNLFSAFLCLGISVVSCLFICGRIKGTVALPCVLLGVFSLFECSVSAGKLALFLCVLITAPIVVTDFHRLRRCLGVFGIYAMALGLSLGFSGRPAERGAVLSFSLSGPVLLLHILAAALILSAIYLPPLKIGGKKLRIWLYAAFALTFVCAIVFVYVSDAESGTIYELSRVMHGEINPEFGSSRIGIWRDTLALVKERPLTGGGPGTLSLRLNIEFRRYVPELGQTMSTNVDNAHNVYLGILADCGLPALIAYLAAVAASVIHALRSNSDFSICLCCGLLAYWIQDFFGLGLFIMTPVVWALWALAVSPKQNKEQSSPASTDITSEAGSPIEE